MKKQILILLCIFLGVVSSANAKYYINSDYDYYRPGGDYNNFIVSSAEQCANKCKVSNRCQAFDYYKSDNSCWLKDIANPPIKYKGALSGVKRKALGAGVEKQSIATENIENQDRNQIRSIQNVIAQKGYNPGPVDGLMGQKTRVALENYQRDNELHVTGNVDSATLASLGLNGVDNSRNEHQPSVVTQGGKVVEGVGDTLTQMGEENSDSFFGSGLSFAGKIYKSIGKNIVDVDQGNKSFSEANSDFQNDVITSK